MYLDYWQLSARPFEPCGDRSAFFPCEAQEAALLKLRYAVENRRGAALLAGPAGVGKTMLLQLFRTGLAESLRPIVHLVFPQMSSRDLLVYLAEQLGAPPADPPRQPRVRGDLARFRQHPGPRASPRSERRLAQQRHADQVQPGALRPRDAL